MLEITDGLPPGVMAIEASGKVTHEDYRDTLIPVAAAKMANGPLKKLYVMGKDFSGFEPETPRNDGVPRPR